MLDQFQFMRPEYLWCLIVPLLIAIYLLKQRTGESELTDAIDPALADVLITDSHGLRKKINAKLIVILTLLSLAAAGPAYDEAPAPTGQGDKATFFVLDLSLSMYAQDLPPSRLDIAKRKLTDLLGLVDTDLYALIVFSGEAYSVVPTSDDKGTISSLIPSLSPSLMPSYGSNIEATIQMLQTQMADHLGHSQVVWITDGIHQDALSEFNQFAQNVPTAVLMLGTEEGAAIPTSSGYLRSNSGIVLAKPTPSDLDDLNVDVVSRSTATNQDVRELANGLNDQLHGSSGTQSDETYDKLIDRGHLIAAVVILLLLGWLRPIKAKSASIVPALVAFILAGPTNTEAANILQSKDRQTFESYRSHPTIENALALSNPRWRAHALAEQQQHQQALETLGMIADPTRNDLLNIANNLVREGAYAQAIANYQRILASDPNDETALTGKAIAEALQKQGEREQQADGDQSENENPEQQPAEQESANEEKNEQDSQENNPSQQEQEQPDDARQSEQEQNQSDSQDNPQQSTQSAEEMISEQELNQELEQLLRSLPDDPGGLLRRKFRYQYEQNRRARAIDNTSGERW